MPTQVSVQLKRQPDGGPWTVHGYMEVDAESSVSTKDTHTNESSIDYDVISLSDDISEVTYAEFLSENLTLPKHLLPAPITKNLVDVTNRNISKIDKKKNVPKRKKKNSIPLKSTKKGGGGVISSTPKPKPGASAVIKKPGYKKTTKGDGNTRATLPGKLFEDWVAFGDGGNYALSADDWSHVRGWTTLVQKNKDFAAEAITFHQLVIKMKSDLGLQAARDCWSDVLPNSHHSNYPLCVLVLMLCTPMVPDTKIIDVFGPFFKENHVDEDWIIKEGEKGIALRLRTLGRQNDSAKYVVKAAIRMKELGGIPRDYRDLVDFMGAGPKVALVTLQEAIGSVQGVPCDVHMCRIFGRLGWIPASAETHSVVSFISNNKKELYNYEMCRAAIEGWFPKKYWPTLNQTWAGLGQLLNETSSKQKIAKYIDEQVSDHNSPWRVADKKQFVSIMAAYSK